MLYNRKDLDAVGYTYDIKPTTGEEGIDTAAIRESSYKLFEIFYNKDISTTGKAFKDIIAHEKAHAFFKHSQFIFENSDYISKKINVMWPDLKNQIEENLKRNPLPNNVEMDLDNILRNWSSMGRALVIGNIAGDHQINSTFLNLKDVECIEEELGKVLNQKIQSVHPSRSNFPLGLTFKEYVHLVIKNLPDELNNFMQSPEFAQALKEAQDRDTNRDTSGEGADGKDKKKEDILGSAAKKKQGQTKKEENDQIQRSEDISKSVGKSQKTTDEIMAERVLSVDELNKVIVMMMTRKIRTKEISNYKRSLRRDDDILLHKGQFSEKVVKDKMYVLFDVSYSMDEQMLKNILESLAELQHYDIVVKTWNTALVQSVHLRDVMETKIRIGGGTCPLSFIPTLEKDTPKTCIIISDFEFDYDPLNKFLSESSTKVIGINVLGEDVPELNMTILKCKM